MASGVVVPFWLDRPANEALDIARAAEELGYDELWIGEMLHFDALALAGAIAGLTRRVTLTVGPLSVALRDPVLLAMGVASLAVLGERPARLALGASSPTLVERWHGREWRGDPNRIEEAATLVREVLRGDRTKHHGLHFHSEGFRSPLAPQPSHITVAGLGPRMIAVAKKCADRLVLNLVPPDFVEKTRARTQLPIAVWVVAAVEPTHDGWQQLARQLALYLRAPGYKAVLAEAGFSDLIVQADRGASIVELADLMAPDQLRSICAVGELDEVRAKLNAYRQAGAVPMLVPITAGDEGGRRTLEALAR